MPIGGRISHYEILAPLGEGKRGRVYAARDTRLGRTVALKFLAPELARYPVAKARFLTEARAASALEHPNLCTVLEVGETAEGLLFLAMPLYQGESLERRLARGPLPIADALDIAIQAARGLAKAHQQGIVHRDVKPANLFLTDDGVVKVLDFGIAKPEQTGGNEIDAWADVWALGAVLYQMLAGRRPFAGGSDAAPEPLAHLRPEVSPEIERIVACMLSKDPGERYAHAGEALVDLGRAQGLASVPPPPEPAIRRRRAVGLLAVTLGLAGVVILGWIGLLVWPRGQEGPGPPPRFIQLTDYPGKETFPSLSPDGKTFVYAKSVAGRSHIFFQRVAGGSPLDLTAGSRSDDTQPAYSPSGEQIAFRSERDGGGIFVMGAKGESVRRLTSFGFNPAWSPDGEKIALATAGVFDPAQRPSRSEIFRLDVSSISGVPRSLGVSDGLQPSWSPHGWRIAYWGLSQQAARRAIWTLPVDGGRPVVVVDDAYYNWSPVWSPDGKFLYFASNRGGSMNLWRVAVDERSGEVRGSPQPITTPSEWSALPSFSRDGRLVLYATNDNHSFIEEVAFDPAAGQITGSPALIHQRAGSIWSCDLSPDGAWLVFWAGSPQDDLFLIRPDGRELRQLTNDPARDRAPRWSPDGNRILFYSNRSGKYEAWTIRPDGSRLTQMTHLPAHNVTNPAWSPDGRQIAFTYAPVGAAIVDGSAPASILRVLPPVQDGQILARVSWSPDGRFLAGRLQKLHQSPGSGIVLWSLATNTYRLLTRSGDDPVFFHGGTQILFTEPDAIRRVDIASGQVETLLSPPPHSYYVSACVGPSDRTLGTVRTSDEGDVWLLSLPESSGIRP